MQIGTGRFLVWFMNSKPQFQKFFHPGASTEVGMVMQIQKLCSSDFMKKMSLERYTFLGLRVKPRVEVFVYRMRGQVS